MADSDASPQSTPVHSRELGRRTEATPGARSSLAALHTDKVPPKTRITLSNHGHDDEKRPLRAVHRSHKHRSSGAFLLSDALRPEASVSERTHTHRRQRTSAENHTTSSAVATPEKAHSNGHANGGQAITPESVSKRSSRISDTMDGVAAAQRDSLTDATTLDGLEHPSAAPLDMDSAQIVNMALNLSESRRQAARRNVSSPLPPRLAQLPDSPAGGSLRQHLQQQRRVSRNISPKPGAVARSVSGQNVSSPLKLGVEPEGSYRYHFSQSTLSRAQKAKDYLELQAQYRKLLDLVPRLMPDRERRPSSNVSPYGSPAVSQSVSRTTTRSFDTAQLGRQYNPLQYIRNRKVRARERKTIDGDAQGFTDVSRVTEWVDEAAKSVTSGQVTDSGSILPLFNMPDEMANDGLSHQPAVNVAKVKRPRVDWVVDPADMLADLYWVEQGTNKNMVEDRDGRRVYVQDSSMYRPLSQQAGDRTNLPAPSSALQDAMGLHVETDPAGLEQKTSRGGSDHIFGSGRERAQQKLHAIKGLHHRHNSSRDHRLYDFRHSRNGSLSDSSDNESEWKGRSRGDTVGSSGKEILEKQMMEMIARERREKELDLGSETRRQRSLTADSVAPEGDSAVPSVVPSRSPSHRQASVSAEANGVSNVKPLPVSPIRSTRASLEVPTTGRRLSIDYDTSHPASPEVKANRGTGVVPALGRDLSPKPSRASSPSRNPLSKVRSIFRDRSRERLTYPDERRGSIDAAGLVTLQSAPDTPMHPMGKLPDERRGSVSPIRKVMTRGLDSNNNSPRGHGSLRHRGDDGYGLKGLLKAPRIDTVLRSGVSRVSDLIWKKDPYGFDPEPSASSDESDTELRRGRTRESASPSDTPGAKTYLNIMPNFVSTSQSHSRPPHGDQGLLYPAEPASRPLSRKSSRFELLKPPKIDIQDTSPNASTSMRKVRSHGDSDTADADSRKSSQADAVRAANTSLNAVISVPQPRRLSTATSQAQRHWSISDGNNRPVALHSVVSRAEIARLRALLLSSGLTAKEIDRRATERRPPACLLQPGLSSARRPSVTTSPVSVPSPTNVAPVSKPTWTSITSLHPDPRVRAALASNPVCQTDLFPTAARTLASVIEQTGTRWQSASQTFSTSTAPHLHREIEAARQTVAGRLSDMTRSAADDADEVSLDLSQGQRLKVKRVVDVIEKMLRRRRRRFRWVRRGLWLGVEWVLVGFMWYVWFVVVIARMFLGVGKGILGAVRWLLWL